MTDGDAGARSRVERHGHTVHRPTNFWSPSVHALLGYLESVDFPAPRVLGTREGVEILTWIDGESGPAGWSQVVSEAGLRRWGTFLRAYHDVVADYHPSPDSEWSSGSRAPAEGELVCHGDFGPWNGVWRGGQVVGLIDWDHARPASRLFDLAYALEYVAPFRDDDECLRWLAYEERPDRARRIEVFCDAYGIAVPERVAELVAWQQREVLLTCESLARQGIEPQATWAKQGYMDELNRRISWTESLKL